MPTVLLIFGIRFFFYPNDHEPVHVHVEYQGRYAKIQIIPEIVQGNRIKIAEEFGKSNPCLGGLEIDG